MLLSHVQVSSVAAGEIIEFTNDYLGFTLEQAEILEKNIVDPEGDESSAHNDEGTDIENGVNMSHFAIEDEEEPSMREMCLAYLKETCL